MNIQAFQSLIYGEILYDLFPDGSEVLGGCAMNVAWHLTGLGLSPILVSRIGTDPLGQKVRKKMDEWGLRGDGVQTDSKNSTGQVKVHIDEQGKISFQGRPPSAFDFIDFRPAESLAQQARLLYYGSYVLRLEKSRETLMKLKKFGLASFVDINLRPPHWTWPNIMAAIQDADYVKMNEEELVEVCSHAQLDTQEKISNAKSLKDYFKIGTLFITLGAQGAFGILPSGTVIQADAPNTESIIDTVGAGDAFCAACIYSLSLGLHPAQFIPLACKFAALSCTYRGATTESLDFYSQARALWHTD